MKCTDIYFSEDRSVCMHTLADYIGGIAQLFFPHRCSGCGSDLLSRKQWLCIHCLQELPETGFSRAYDNPVEKIFWGRTPVAAATAQFYFTKKSSLQHTLHAFKYSGKKLLGIYLGKLMAEEILQGQRFQTVDLIVPLPLFWSREKKRGYNQSQVLSEGMAGVLSLPVLSKAVQRRQLTSTQTKKTRIERWRNMENKFLVSDPSAVKGKHVLLVDDIITTGATLEACAQVLHEAGATVSIAALAYSVSD